ncbi:MAG: TatD family hydrolase [Lachnospiraceae bacterium]|nr:TatD family hydrolase [Lachnospiraceae bacterium]
MIFDTHAHYDDEQFDTDRDALLQSMRGRGVGCIVNVGASTAGCRAAVRLAGQYDFIYAALGIHPDEVGSINDDFFSWMRSEAESNPKVVAIGEIGLDYHWDVEPREVQKEWFLRQMELARDLSLPIAVHSRDAAQDTFDLISRYGRDLPGILHCFSYSPEMAAEYVKLGYYIGLGGVVTFKNAKKAKETAQIIPLERIMLETDCPYMAPTPFRGKRNSSDLIVYVAEEIARIKEISTEEVISVTEENAKRLFQL